MDDRHPVHVPPVLAPIMEGYLRNRRSDIERLSEMIPRSDFDSIWRIGHGMKGSGTTYGMPELTRIGADLEASAKDGDLRAVRESYDRLVAYLGSVELIYPEPEEGDGL